MQIKYSYSGSKVVPIKFCDKTTSDLLDPAIYMLDFNPLSGYYLSLHKHEFELPTKVYGHNEDRSDRIINAFEDRVKSTGVLLSGDKGSGKTMLAQTVCNKLIAKGYPVILVNDEYYGTQFEEFIEMLGKCVVMFDEFAKVYTKKEAQGGMLGFFDGNSSSKRLSIVTENTTRNINEFMMDRPGRFFYHFRYEKLEEEVIKEFCSDRGISGEDADSIIEYSRQTTTFSFDILNAICEEIVRSGMKPTEVFDILNIPTIYNTTYENATINKITTGNDVKDNLNVKIGVVKDGRIDCLQVPDYLLYPETYHKDDKSTSWVRINSETLRYRKGNNVVLENDGIILHITLKEKEYNFRNYAF